MRTLSIHLYQEAYNALEDEFALAATLIEARSLLAEQPKLGRVRRVKGTRELVISGMPYITAYKISGEAIYILRVLHGARNWKKQFNK